MARFAVLLLTIVFFVGCSLVDPFVTRKKAAPPPLTESVKLTDAFDYAARVKEVYRSALRDQALLQSWLGIGLVPLTAAAIGLGATGTSPNTVLSLGLGGASALGIGTWLYNKPRQLAWVAGLKAVTCAEDAVIPLLPFDGKTLETDLTALSTKIPILERQIATVAEIIDRFEPDFAKLSLSARSAEPQYERLLKDAKDELSSAKSLITSADAAYSAGTDVEHMVSTAGQRLLVAIDKIVDAVDGIIVETQRDPQALSTIISGLGATYKTITTVPEVFKGIGQQAPPMKAQGELPVPATLPKTYLELSKALGDLRQQSADLSEARRRIAGVVNMISKDAPLKALESCGVKAGDVVTALTVDPAPPFQLAKSASMGFVVKGGVPPYAATIKGPSDGVSVSPAAPPFSVAFSLTASKDAQAGTYVLNLFDSSGQAKSVVVTVDGASAPKDGPSKTPGGGQATPVTDAEFNQLVQEIKGKSFRVGDTGVTVKVSDLQLDQGKVTVSVDVDSVAAPKLDAFTEEAVAKALLATSASGIPSKQIAIKDFGAVRKAAEAKTSTACGKIELEKSVKSDAEPLFAKLSGAERHKLQTAMCLKDKDVDGVWGPKTKYSLEQYQCRTGRTPDGKLTDALVAELLKLTPEEVTKQCQVK